MREGAPRPAAWSRRPPGRLAGASEHFGVVRGLGPAAPCGSVPVEVADFAALSAAAALSAFAPFLTAVFASVPALAPLVVQCEQVTETPGHPSASRRFRRRIGRDRGLVVAQGEDSVV